MKNEAEKPIVYRESQGRDRDSTILERYELIINYFAQNPNRAAIGINELNLRTLYFNDRVLMQNEQLREKLREKVLNSPEAKIERSWTTLLRGRTQ